MIVGRWEHSKLAEYLSNMSLSHDYIALENDVKARVKSRILDFRKLRDDETEEVTDTPSHIASSRRTHVLKHIRTSAHLLWHLEPSH